MWIIPVARLLLACSLCIAFVHSQRIPEHLVHCYRSGNNLQTNNDSNNALPPIYAPQTAHMPHTLQLFIELLRKIEDANPTSLDMRQLSVQLTHRLRLDGIERATGVRETAHVTPFRAVGIQTAKFQLLLQLISDSTARLAFADWLTPAELCHLHRMLSATVEPWERGDEWRVCPLSVGSAERRPLPWLKRNHVQDPESDAATVTTARLSRCPLEGGCVRSREYGSLTVGTVVASIAAGLQPQRVGVAEFFQARDFLNVIDERKEEEAEVVGEYVEVGDEEKEEFDSMQRRRRRQDGQENTYGRLRSSMDSVDNTYAAGLAGDLAEVCVFQSPYVGTNVSVGLEGVWNSTLYPRIRHFPDASHGRWELTDAEILAGIDGLFLSQQIAAWQRKVRRLRLSQVVDMFYSSRGIPVVGIKLLPHDPRTTTNSNYLAKRFSTRDDLSSACDRRTVLQLIDRETLQSETWHMAQLLQFRRSSMSVPDAVLRETCAAAVRQFVAHAERLVAALPACSRVKEFAARPVVDLTLVLDGSRTEAESLELVSFLVEAIDVSNTGSWLSVIHGQTGQYMVRRTRSVASVFEQLYNCSGAFPTSLSVANALQRLSLTLANRTRSERQRAVIAAESPVVLMMSQKQRIGQQDFDSAYSIMHDALLQFTDLYYVFVTNAVDQFEELVNHRFDDGTAPEASSALQQRRQRRWEHYNIIDAASTDAQHFGAQLSTHLDMIPKRIMAPFCRNDSDTEYNLGSSTGGSGFVFFEDYIGPYQEHRYRIGAEHIEHSAVLRVQFQVNYGSVSVCMARELTPASRKCHSIGEADTAEFEVVAPCATAQSQQRRCSGVYFFVSLDQSEMRCTETRCRYPDQVLVIMRHSGLRCERDDRSAGWRTGPMQAGLMIAMAIIMPMRGSIWL